VFEQAWNRDRKCMISKVQITKTATRLAQGLYRDISVNK
jgi:hypothetical protein